MKKMNTVLLKITEKNLKKQAKKAAEIILNKGIIAYPTETSYGLGCLTSDLKLIKKLARVKKQPLKKPISVLVSTKKMIKENFKTNQTTKKLIHKFFPGALTLISEKKKNKMNGLIQDKIAFRISSNKFAFYLTKFVGEPITATSANIHGEPNIYDFKKLFKVFNNKINCVCDAGKLAKIKPSTIFDCETKTLIRKGPIKEKEIEKVLE